MKPERKISGSPDADNARPEDRSNEGATSPSAPPAPTQLPDPFDPDQFAANSSVQGSFGVVKELVTCPVRKPNKQEFVRVHPDPAYQLRAHILELKEERETYLVIPEVAHALPGETRTVILRLATNRQGAVFLWPVKEPGLDGREDSWGRSARAAASKAETDWVRVIANMSQGAYDLYTAAGAIGTPAWPNKSMRDVLEVAFGEKLIIRDPGHPVIRRLLGRA
jgi:hypothetical protein